MRNLWASYGQNAKMNCNHYKKSESEKQRLVFTSPSQQTILRTLESLTGSMTRPGTVFVPRFLDNDPGQGVLGNFYEYWKSLLLQDACKC